MTRVHGVKVASLPFCRPRQFYSLSLLQLRTENGRTPPESRNVFAVNDLRPSLAGRPNFGMRQYYIGVN